MDKIIYNASELCGALGVTRYIITVMEQGADPLPFFTLPGSAEHYYPRIAVEAWAARQCEQGQR